MVKQIAKLSIGELKLNKDFVVITKMGFYRDGGFVPYTADGLERQEYTVVMDTPFVEELIEHVYDFFNHDFDLSLATQLGLGVIQDTNTMKMYIYNAETAVGDDYSNDEAMRVGMYYQLTHPEYDDKNLDILLNSAGGEEYLKLLMLNPSDDIINKLKVIFDSRKGRGDNVIPFKK